MSDVQDPTTSAPPAANSDGDQMPASPLAPPPAVSPPVPPSPPAGKKELEPVKASLPLGEEPAISDETKFAEEEGDKFWLEYAAEIKEEERVKELGGMEKIQAGEVPVPEDLAREMGIGPKLSPPPPPLRPVEFSVRGVTLSDDQLTEGEKKPLDNAYRWLVTWFIYQLQKAHYHIKVIKGKITREPPGQHTHPGPGPKLRFHWTSFLPLGKPHQ